MIKKYEKFLENKIQVGSMTNKGKVLFIDTPYKTSGNAFDTDSKEWKHNPEEEGKDANILVKTDQGWFNLSDIQAVEEKPTETIKSEAPVTSVKSEIEFPELMKMDIRVCKVEDCQKIPKKDKLLLLKVNTGFDERQIVTNLGGTYTPEQLNGKNFAFILNLKPAKIGGIESNGMIIAASSEGKPYLIEISAPIGSVVL